MGVTYMTRILAQSGASFVGDFINSMFCSTAVLRAGPVWLDIKAAMTLALPSKVFCGSRLCVWGSPWAHRTCNMVT